MPGPEGARKVRWSDPTAPDPAVEPRPLTILLVEDEPLSRLTAYDMVTDSRSCAYEAGNADQAWAFCQKPSIDVMITDIGLPGMSGASLAGRWQALAIDSGSLLLQVWLRLILQSGLSCPLTYYGSTSLIVLLT